MPPSSLFLPFTKSGKAIELRAIEAKEKLGFSPYDVIDPEQILDRVPARLIDPLSLQQASPQVAAVLLKNAASEWSAICFGRSPGNGDFLILVNPTHHSNRRRVSLMEEIIHITLDHPMTELVFGDSGTTWIRPFAKDVEDEAYTAGAACILPYRFLFRLVNDLHQPAAAIAQERQVSEEYVIFRIKRAGLMRIYSEHCT